MMLLLQSYEPLRRWDSTEKDFELLSQLILLQSTIVGWFKDRLSGEEGASLVEYALLLALIAVVAIGALIFLGHTASNSLNSIANNLNNTP
jgi:pilus assembly protein Flp/PilA